MASGAPSPCRRTASPPPSRSPPRAASTPCWSGPGDAGRASAAAWRGVAGLAAAAWVSRRGGMGRAGRHQSPGPGWLSSA